MKGDQWIDGVMVGEPQQPAPAADGSPHAVWFYPIEVNGTKATVQVDYLITQPLNLSGDKIKHLISIFAKERGSTGWNPSQESQEVIALDEFSAHRIAKFL